MSRIVRVGIDLDGVLVDFIVTMVTIMRDKVGIMLDKDFQPDSWNWDNANLPDHAMVDAWKIIDSSPRFWEQLYPLPEIATMRDFFNQKAEQHDIYFITARKNGLVGLSAKVQSENWLTHHLAAPINEITVLPVRHALDKLPVLEALGIDYFIDDHGKTITKATEQCPHTKSFLLSRPWNVKEQEGVKVVKSLKEFFDYVEKDMF